MKTLTLHKGQRCVDAVVTISIEAKSGCDCDYNTEADQLFDILVSSIPGGTYDSLCVKLQRYWRQCYQEQGVSFSCKNCGWHGYAPIALSNGAHCPNCEEPATPHDD